MSKPVTMCVVRVGEDQYRVEGGTTPDRRAAKRYPRTQATRIAKRLASDYCVPLTVEAVG